VLVASVAFAPRTGAGLMLVMVAAIGARMCWSGVVTLRATVWQANYPRSTRARMAGKLATIQALTLSGVGVVIAFAMSRNDDAFRALYPATAAVGLAGALVYGRMRVRGHRALRRRERDGDRSVQQLLSPAAIARVLNRDPLFARYMALMFVFGLGNLMIVPVLVNVLRDEFGFGYRGGILIAATIPVGLMPLSIPLWARLLDRMHILRFRAVHCWSFLAATAVFTLGGITHWAACLWIGSALRGLAIGGGVLAWNLGHQDFTDPSGGAATWACTSR
jgi:hypothetical protein